MAGVGAETAGEETTGAETVSAAPGAGRAARRDGYVEGRAVGARGWWRERRWKRERITQRPGWDKHARNEGEYLFLGQSTSVCHRLDGNGFGDCLWDTDTPIKTANDTEMDPIVPSYTSEIGFVEETMKGSLDSKKATLGFNAKILWRRRIKLRGLIEILIAFRPPGPIASA